MAASAGLPVDRLHQLGRVSDDDLAAVLDGATVLAAPSRAEGFGLPAARGDGRRGPGGGVRRAGVGRGRRRRGACRSRSATRPRSAGAAARSVADRAPRPGWRRGRAAGARLHLDGAAARAVAPLPRPLGHERPPRTWRSARRTLRDGGLPVPAVSAPTAERPPEPIRSRPRAARADRRHGGPRRPRWRRPLRRRADRGARRRRCRPRSRLPARRRRALRPARARTPTIVAGPAGVAQPAGPAGLGADRPAAGRRAGRRRTCCTRRTTRCRCAPAMPVVVTIHDATFFTEPDVHTAVKGAVLPLRDPDRAAPGGPLRGPVARRPATSWSGSSTRTRPGSTSRYHGVDQRTFHVPTEAERQPVRGPARPAAHGLRRLPRHAGAAQERARADPRLGRGRARTGADPPALVLAGGSGWDDEIDQARRRGAEQTCGCCGRATCRSPTCAGLLGGATVVAYPSARRGLRAAGAGGDGLRRRGADHAAAVAARGRRRRGGLHRDRSRTSIAAALARAARRPRAPGRARRGRGGRGPPSSPGRPAPRPHLAAYARAAGVSAEPMEPGSARSGSSW